MKQNKYVEIIQRLESVNDEILNPNDVAEMMGITPDGVRANLRRGVWPGVMKHRRWRISKAKFIHYLTTEDH